jgi:hypothetical protein
MDSDLVIRNDTHETCRNASLNTVPQSLAQSYCSPCGVSRERMNHHCFLFLYFAVCPSNLPGILYHASQFKVTFSAEYLINRHVSGTCTSDWTVRAFCRLFGELPALSVL